ncbi:MAG TPA: RNA polymerase sigma factor [Candidatus Binatia bacterium]|nr:RNA polymerase sigma factor [Candidatus Binatia bacterium]
MLERLKSPRMAVMPPDPASVGPETIEELFAALESPLLSYALRLAGDRTLAEDLVQEAFMRLHAQFDEVREPRRWLYRTVHNLALNQRRQAGKIVSLDLPAANEDAPRAETADPQPLPDEQIARLEGIGLVRLSLETLDDRSRELVRLKFNENLSYKEISARTGLTMGHVGYLLHHALKAIGEELAKNGVVE